MRVSESGWIEAPSHLIRDRAGAFGPAYIRRIQPRGSAIIRRRRVHGGRSPCSRCQFRARIGFAEFSRLAPLETFSGSIRERKSPSGAPW
jgi:hypothetical protein